MQPSETSRAPHFVLVAAVLAGTQPVMADALHDHDNGPLTGFFGIPDSTEGSAILDPGADRWSALVMTASHSIKDVRNGESIILDGETTRLELAYRRGIAPNFELGIEVPLL